MGEIQIFLALFMGKKEMARLGGNLVIPVTQEADAGGWQVQRLVCATE